LARASFLVVNFSLNKDFPMVNYDHLTADSPLFNGKLYQKMLETKCSLYRFWIDARRFNDSNAKNRNVIVKANEDGLRCDSLSSANEVEKRLQQHHSESLSHPNTCNRAAIDASQNRWATHHSTA